MTAQILVVDDEPDLEGLIQQKFRHQIRDGAIRSYSPAMALKLWPFSRTVPSTWW